MSWRICIIPILLLTGISCDVVEKDMPASFSNADSLLLFIREKVDPYLHNRQTENVKKTLDSLSPFVETIDNYELTCSFLHYRSSQKMLEDDPDSARFYIDKAMHLALRQDTTKKVLISMQIQLANILEQQNLHDSALRYATEAYYLAKKKDTSELPTICYRLYEIYSSINDLPSMRKYLFEGLTISNKPVFKTIFANGITEYYDRMNQVDSALYFFRNVETDTTFSSPYFDAIKYHNLGLLLTKNSRLQDGLYYQLKAMILEREIGEPDYISHLNLAETYRKLKQYEKSNSGLDTALSLAKQEEDWQVIKEIWQVKAANYKDQHMYSLAFAAQDSAFKQFKMEVDSSIIKQAKEIETKYAVKTKDDMINTLAFQNEINQKINNQQRIIIASLIVVVLLLTSVGYLLYRRRKMQIELHEAQLQQKLLRSQMEPHFIFNSLGVLLSFIRADQAEKSSDYLEQFSKLLRLTLENTRENLVPLKKEVEALEEYMHLQSINFAGKFDYAINVYNSYKEDEIMIPPMLIQPFVENAIQHGFPHVNHKGTITVQIQKRDHQLHCVIEDNGTGLKVANPGNVRRSFSTQITQERLSILAKQTGKRANLIITDKQTESNEQGVRVTLDIPFLTNQ